MTPDERIQRGEHARQLMSDPLLAEAFDGLESGAIERLAACSVNDVAKLQTLTMALQTVRSVRGRLETWVVEGREEAIRRAKKEEQPPSLLGRFRRAA